MAIKIEVYIALTPRGGIYCKMQGANTNDACERELSILKSLKPCVEESVLSELKNSGYRVEEDFLMPGGKSH
ncbi:hypothetical protein AAHV69_26990 (plasmid) [Klebsiella pneumoniae]|nr:hypothetical protein [Klebsiella pneumoniae]